MEISISLEAHYRTNFRERSCSFKMLIDHEERENADSQITLDNF